MKKQLCTFLMLPRKHPYKKDVLFDFYFVVLVRKLSSDASEV